VPLPAPAAPSPQPMVLPDPDSIAGLKLLLVEDEAAVRSILDRGLRRFGPVVTLAEDATVALDSLASDCGIDVIISDIMMPGIDGVELASRARALRPGIGIVLMSGFAEAPLYRAADAQGIRFLSKPFALADLVAAIAAANAERSTE
jgi:two-component system cell cycle sensor histidine kinase/response regulator CckA